MPILTFYKKIIAAVLISCVVLLSPIAAANSLDQAIRASLENSTAIAAARQTWITTREDIGSNTATSDLSARLTSTGALGQSDNQDGRGFIASHSLSTGITLSKNIYDGGQSAENVALGEINLQIATANYKKIEQSVILATVEAYLNIFKTRREAKLHDENLSRLAAHVNAARIRVVAGAATPTRLAEANARYAHAQSDAILTDTRLNNAKDNFRSITGRMPDNFAEPAVATNLPKDLHSAETIALSDHPDILIIHCCRACSKPGL